jgi:uncharacterized membrane protein YkvA (DUF1232 family)
VILLRQQYPHLCDPKRGVVDWLLITLGVVLALYLAGVLTLLAMGRRTEARALAGFIPDCVVLVKRLLGDPRVPRRRKVVLALLVGYLLMPIDLVPDFIPVVGQLDDVIVAALAIRVALRAGGEALLEEHWPGPEASLGLVRRAAFGRPSGP